MELEQKRIVYCRRQLAQTSACTETADCIVPDAFPDVGRVVYACGTAAIGDHAPQNGRLLISGTVQAVISYEPENGGWRCRSASRTSKNVRSSTAARSVWWNAV